MVMRALTNGELVAIEQADEAGVDPPSDALVEALAVALSSALPSAVLLVLSPVLRSAVVAVVVVGVEIVCVTPFTTTSPPEASKDTVVPSTTTEPPRVRVVPSMTKPDDRSAV
jgi:hypothetical protein